MYQIILGLKLRKNISGPFQIKGCVAGVSEPFAPQAKMATLKVIRGQNYLF